MPDSDKSEDYKNLDLVVFGLPRSANTYLSSNLSFAFEGVRLKTNIHNFNRILWIQEPTNVIVLVRRPEDLVKSLLHMNSSRYKKLDSRLRIKLPIEDYLVSESFKLINYLDWLNSPKFRAIDYLVINFSSVIEDLNLVNEEIYRKFPSLGKPKKVNSERIKERVRTIDRDIEATIYESHLPTEKLDENDLVKRLMESSEIKKVIDLIYEIYNDANIKIEKFKDKI
jgi:hypothetical protein